MAGAPPFDPTQPFEVVKSIAPPFDPAQPFEVVKPTTGPTVTVKPYREAESPPTPPLYHGTEPQAVEASSAPTLPIARSAAQGVARGALNLPFLLPDIATAGANLGIGALNLGIAGFDKSRQMSGGAPVPQRLPYFPSPSDTASGLISQLMPEGAVVNPEQLGPEAHGAYNIARMATEALGGGAALARAAAKRGAASIPIARPGHAPPLDMPTRKPSMIDPLIRPYEGETIGKTLTGDVAAGVGAGTAATGVERNDALKDSALAKGFASILGGGVGAGMPAIIRSPKSVLQAVYESFPDPNIPRDPLTGAATSRRVAGRAAEFTQRQATDPTQAALRLRTRVQTAQEAGAPPPTSGIGSDDIGLSAMEKSARTKNQVAFAERDADTIKAVHGQVTGLLDPNAEQKTVTTFAKDRPEQIRDEAYAAASPLLQRAESAGARVNAQPVADLIESQLQSTKREPVIQALTAVRSKLNKLGSDQLDDSVSGLYETRKVVNDTIAGRSETPTGRFAKSELIAVRDALDKQITDAAPEFGAYLAKYKEKIASVNALEDNPAFVALGQKDPRDVAKKLLSGNEYGAQDDFQRINKEVRGTPVERPWKAAVSEVLADKVTTTNTALVEGDVRGPVSPASLQRTFKANEKALSDLYGPEGMQKLRRVHRILEPFGNLARHAISGSQTEPNRQLTNAVENAVLVYTGNAVTAGMIMHRMRRAASMLPGLQNMTLEAKLNRLTDRMWFDADLADYLLLKPVKKEGPAFNKSLNELIGAGESAREVNDNEPK